MNLSLVTNSINQREQQRFIRLAWFVIILLLIGLVVQSLTAILNFDGAYGDGPLQLFNPLRRISAGLPFEFFHGKGIPYLHYPIFALLGRTIFASEAARYFVSLAAFTLSMVTLAWVIFRKQEQRLFFMVVLSAIAYVIDGIAIPSNSLLGLRSTMPLFVFVVLFIPLRFSVRVVLLGLCLTLTIFLGSEQAAAFLLSFGAVQGLLILNFVLQRRWRDAGRQVAFTAVVLLITVVLTFAGLVVMSGGVQEALTTLRYNYAEVSGDQFWYFGVPPNNFAYNIVPFLRPQYSLPVGIAVVLLIAFAARLWKGRLEAQFVRTERHTIAFVTLLGYGMLSMAAYLGYLGAGYVITLLRIIIFTLCYTLFSYREFKLSMLHRLKSDFRLQKWFVLFILVFIFLLRPPYGLIQLIKIGLDRDRPALAALSPAWSNYLAGTVATIQRTRTDSPDTPPVIWSTYAGLIQDTYHTFNPADDYIIHALGPTRRDRYLQTFRDTKPEYVETLRKLASQYEEWLQSTTWDFYELVLTNYDAILATDHTILWQRHPGPWVELPTNCTTYPVPDRREFAFPSALTALGSDYSLAVVQVQYTVSNPWRWLPLIGGLPRNLVTPSGSLTKLPISLPPYRSEARFPIAFRNGQTPVLSFDTFSLLPGASYAVSAVCIRLLPMTPQVHDFVTLDLDPKNPQPKDGPFTP